MSFIGNLFGGGPSNNEKQANNLLNYNAQSATPYVKNAVARGNTVIDSGQQALNRGLGFLHQFSSTAAPAANYFQNLLSGNRANTAAALSPETANIAGGLNKTLQATSTLTPRGGGRSSTLFNLPYQAETTTAGLYNSLRPQAAQNLSSIAQMLGSVGLGQENTGAGLVGAGTGLLNNGVNFLNAGTDAARGFGGLAYEQQKRKNEISSNIGGALGKVAGAALGGFFGI